MLLSAPAAVTGQQPGRLQVPARVLDADGEPVERAVIALLEAEDSLQIDGLFTDSTGGVRFENVEPGIYLLKAWSTGLPAVYSGVFQVLEDRPAPELPALRLEMRSAALGEVVIRGRKGHGRAAKD